MTSLTSTRCWVTRRNRVTSPLHQTILGFNEPNQADQADMTPQEAAAAWLEVMERLVMTMMMMMVVEMT